MDRCEFINDKGKKVFIPGCMGGAVYGKSGCTCPTEKTVTDEMEDRIVRLEKKVEKLEALKGEALCQKRNIYQ